MIYLRGWRTRADMTLKEVGEKVGRHHMTIYKWENGLLFPDVRDIQRLADAFKVHPAALFVDPNQWPQRQVDTAHVFSELSGFAPEAYLLARRDRRLARQLTECMKALERLPREARGSAVSLLSAAADIWAIRPKRRTSDNGDL